jgi:aminoglycoside phosphotransferase
VALERRGGIGVIDAHQVARRVLRDAGHDDGNVRVVHLNRTGPEGDFVVLIVFSGESDTPTLLMKATQSAKKAELLRREFANLSLLEEHGADALSESVPRPVDLNVVDGVTIFAETALPGIRMKNRPPDRYFRSPEFQRHLDRVVTFLADLHRCGEQALPPGDLSIEEAVLQYRAAFEVSPELDSLLDETLTALHERELPSTVLHGDFCTANVLVGDADNVGVIDWEFPLRRQWPLADYLHFLSSVWVIPYRKGFAGSVDRYRHMFFESHALAPAVRAGTLRYLRSVKIAAEDVLPLSVATWLLYANRKIGSDEDWPLVLIDRGRCLNLELLATHRDRYLLGAPSLNQPGNP